MDNLEDMELDHLNGLEVPEGAGEFSLPAVVLRVILENLSSTDLLKVSFVNKSWHYEALSVLRGRRTLTAKMNSADGRCKDLRAFASDLQRMKEVRKVIPFSGLTIAINGVDGGHGDYCEESGAGELDPTYEDILNQIHWKHLGLDLRLYSVESENCAGLQLVKKVLQNRWSSLQELSLKFFPNVEALEFCIRNLTQDFKFPSLRTLKFKGSRYGGDEDLIKALVSRSPNLKILDTKGRVNLHANLLEGSFAEHVLDQTFVFPDNADLPQRILGQLRLRRLEFQYLHLERLGMIQMLLRNSRSTLTYMRVGAVVLVLFEHYGICLENVRKLVVQLSDSEVTQARSRRRLKSFDFTHILPNLGSVRIDPIIGGPDDERIWNAVAHMLDQGNPEFVQPPNRTANVNELILDCAWRPSIPDSSIRFLVQMFPHVKKLAIEADFPILLARFWDLWLELEELDVTRCLDDDDNVENFDSVFCGIFPQEVARLREEDDEYLENVNIVPVMPSLCSFKRLRTFKLFFGGRVDPTSTISKVSGWIAFKRCPDLSVTLETNSYSWRRALLELLGPYATVQPAD